MSTLNFPVYYLIPVIGALIGWITNLLAVKMLFHPRRKISLLLFSLHGVFPKRKAALAHKLGEVVSNELLSGPEIVKTIKESTHSDKMDELIDQQIDKVIREKLPAAFPMLAMVLSPELVETIKGMFKEEIYQMMDDFLESTTGAIEESLDVHKLVEDKVNAFSVEKMEELVFSIMRREFKFIELVGAVLGFLIGLVQVLLVDVTL